MASSLLSTQKQSVWSSPSTLFYPVQHYCLWMVYWSGWYSLRHYSWCSHSVYYDGVTLYIMMESLWGGKVCLQTFLAICFTRGMHVQFVFTTRFEMLSVFITRQSRSCHWVLFTAMSTARASVTHSGLETWWNFVYPMNKFVTSTCNTI